MSSEYVPQQIKLPYGHTINYVNPNPVERIGILRESFVEICKAVTKGKLTFQDCNDGDRFVAAITPHLEDAALAQQLADMSAEHKMIIAAQANRYRCYQHLLGTVGYSTPLGIINNVLKMVWLY